MTDARRTARVRLLVSLMQAGARLPSARVAGLTLKLADGVCNPSPAPGLSLARLLKSGVEDLAATDVVLDVGTGSGVWAILAGRHSNRVTATDLPHVPLEVVAENAGSNGVTVPELLHGDLFSPVAGRRFDRILFNPPFHVGTPDKVSEKAYLGGPEGNVLRRFLTALPSSLSDQGSACIILPHIEREQYADALAPFNVSVRARQWVPVLGTVYCLDLEVC